MTQTPDTIDRIATAIGRPSRRTVARGVAWSLPAIAVGVAAPAEAASPGACPACTPSGPPQCLLAIPNGTGTCTCPQGLACVGTGPLGLANVCVGVDVAPLVVSCGGTSCTGVCLGAGGAVVDAFNTLVTVLGTVYTSLQLLSGPVDELDTCSQLGTLPSNICVSPFNDGGLGSLCIEQFSCGAGITSILSTLNAAITTFVGVLTAAGIAVTNQCAAPYVCKGGASIAVDNDSALGLTFAVRVNVGICQCGPATSCPDSVGGFDVAC